MEATRRLTIQTRHAKKKYIKGEGINKGRLGEVYSDWLIDGEALIADLAGPPMF